jgi:DNA-binding MarR family transcriptional regulator
MKTKDSKIDLSECPSCLNFNIRKAMRAVSQHYDKIMAPSGLRATQFTILTVLNSTDSVTITELANYLVMERTTLTRNLKPLEKEGYLKIIPDIHDRRSRRIKITSSGEKIQKAAMPYWREAQEKMVSFMGKTNSKQFISDLQFVATSHVKL